MKIRKGDKVAVITGKDKGKQGTVLSVFAAENQIVVEGINLRTRHIKAKKAGQSGERVTAPAPLHLSNVMLVCPHTSKPTRVGIKISGETKVRMSKKAGKEI